MYIIETTSGAKHQIEIIPLDEGDYKLIEKDRYFFDWKTEKEFEVYKLKIIGSNEILGLISFVNIPEEWRLHIRLLTVSIENKGEGKRYELIAGNLIAFVARIAIKEYAEFACVSLNPKSHIAQHYIDKYKMRTTGVTLSIEMPEILDLIKLYDHE